MIQKYEPKVQAFLVIQGSEYASAHSSSSCLHEINLKHLPCADIVYASEFCTLDVATEREHIRQLFYQGKPVSPYIRRSGDELPDLASFIRISFTPDPTIFQTCVTTAEQLKWAVTTEGPNTVLPDGLRIKTIRESDSGFEMILKCSRTLEQEVEKS